MSDASGLSPSQKLSSRTSGSIVPSGSARIFGILGRAVADVLHLAVGAQHAAVRRDLLDPADAGAEVRDRCGCLTASRNGLGRALDRLAAKPTSNISPAMPCVGQDRLGSGSRSPARRADAGSGRRRAGASCRRPWPALAQGVVALLPMPTQSSRRARSARRRPGSRCRSRQGIDDLLGRRHQRRRTTGCRAAA